MSKFDFENTNDEMMAAINVTPLVDVMLVLLVIFMISAPLMFSGISLNLPKTESQSNLKVDTKQVVLSITKLGHIYLGENKVLLSELVPLIKEQFGGNQNSSAPKIVYVRADESLKYGLVVDVMAFLKERGIDKISLVTETEK